MGGNDRWQESFNFDTKDAARYSSQDSVLLTCPHMSTCAHVCSHVHTHVRKCQRARTHVQTCPHKGTDVLTCAHMCAPMHTCANMRTYVKHMPAHGHTCPHMACPHMPTHVRTCAHMSTHGYANMCAPTQRRRPLCTPVPRSTALCCRPGMKACACNAGVSPSLLAAAVNWQVDASPVNTCAQ